MAEKANRATDEAKRPRYASKARAKAYRRPAKKYYAKSHRAARPRVNQLSKQLAMKIPECSSHYIQALFDPFTTMGGVCVPADSFPLPSQKVKVFNRGTINLGTTGFGFIYFAPTPWNDLIALTGTTSASVGNASTVYQAFTNLGSGVFNQLPYNTADRAANTVQARVVASGVRVRYAGTENNRQGLYVSLEEQDHADTSTTLNFLTTRTQAQSDTRRPSGDGNWDQTVCLSGPISPQEYEFTTLQYPISNTTAGTFAAPLVIGMQGGVGDSIEYECVIHVEYIGSKVPGKTQSHSDSLSYGKVVQATKEIAAIKPVQPSGFKEGWAKFTSALSASLPQLIDVGMNAAAAIATRNPMAFANAAGGATKLLMANTQGGRVPTRTQQFIMA